MLDTRDHLLPDIAALIEIDAAELVHVGFVRKGVAVGEIHAAARHAECDAVRLVGFGFGKGGAKIVGRFGRKLRRQHDPPSQRGKPRIRVAKAIFAVVGAVPDRHDAEHLRQVLDPDFGAQLVEIELIHKRARERLRDVEEEATPIVRRCFGHDEIADDLALRGEQRGVARPAGRDHGDIVGDEPVEKAPGVVTCDFEDAAVGEQRCLHEIPLPSLR
jgi:hypothetical protein